MIAGDSKASLDAGNRRRARSPKDTPRARRQPLDVDDLARIVAAYRRIRHDLIGRPATVIGRPDLTGEVESVSLNPHGVVIVTLRTPKPNPRRIRFPADACTYGERITAPPRKRRHPLTRQFKRPEPIALDHQGRLVVA